MLLNKRGAALLQVLIVAAILAGMSAMILRVTLSRQITSRKSRHTVAAQSVIEACMAQVSAIWAAKTPAAYARDLAACQMCDPSESADGETNCPAVQSGATEGDTTFSSKKYICNISLSDDQSYQVEANMETSSGSTQPCKVTYTILNSRNTL